MRCVFISYSRKDGNDAAATLEDTLKAKDFRYWRDLRDIDPTKDFTAEIEKGIESVSHVVVCITPDTKRADSFVRREIQYALASGKPVIPLRFADILPHVHIINNERVDYFCNAEMALQRIIAIVSGAPYENQPSDIHDPFRPYVQYLYKRVVDYLDRSVVRLIDLSVEVTPDAVAEQPKHTDMFDLLFSPHNTKDEALADFSNFREAFEHYEGRMLLLGQPGAGKTITLLALARDAAVARLDDVSLPLPLFGIIPSWDTYKQPHFADWLSGSYTDLDTSTVRAEMDSGKALLLLDSLDELGSERPVDPEKPEGEKFDPRLRFIENVPSNNQILVTCRVADYADIGEKSPLSGAVTLQPMTDAQIADYLKEQPELLELTQSDEQLRELLQTPLLLSYFAFAYQDMTDEERAQLTELPHAGDVRDKIFRAYVEKRYRYENHKCQLSGETPPYTLEDIYHYMGWGALQDASRFANAGIFNARDFEGDIQSFIEFMIRLNILVQNEAEPARFIHKLLRDYFALPYATKYSQNVTQDKGPKAWALRGNSIMALGRIGDVRSFPLLYEILSNHRELPADRASAAQAIATFGDNALEILLSVAQSKDENTVVRVATVLSFQRLGKTAVVPLIDILKDKTHDANIRHWVAEVLGFVNDTRAISPLIDALNDTEPLVRSGAIDALGHIGNKQAIEPLILLLSDTADGGWGRRVCDYAAEALGKLGDLRGINFLVALLRNANEKVRRYAVGSLGTVGDIRTVEPLKTAMKSDADIYVQRKAAKALERISTSEAIAAVEKWRSEQQSIDHEGEP